MIKKINPEERFSITSFPKPYERFYESGEKANDPTLYEVIFYECNDCSEKVVFEERHFKKHSTSKFSNLEVSIQQEISNFIKSNNLETHSFLDFYCGKCSKPIRLYYSDGYGGRHGDYFVTIEYILEFEYQNRITEP